MTVGCLLGDSRVLAGVTRGGERTFLVAYQQLGEKTLGTHVVQYASIKSNTFLDCILYHMCILQSLGHMWLNTLSYGKDG